MPVFPCRHTINVAKFFPTSFCFVIESLYLLLSLSYFSALLTILPVYSLYLHFCFCLVMFVHLFCCLDSIYKWNLKVFVFLISLRIIASRSTHVAANGPRPFKGLWASSKFRIGRKQSASHLYCLHFSSLLILFHQHNEHVGIPSILFKKNKSIYLFGCTRSRLWHVKS